jgi:hypothetical protein
MVRAMQLSRNQSGGQRIRARGGPVVRNIDENESFRVLSVDEDAELVELEYLDGDIEEIDLETWHELDLDKIDEPEGWAGSRRRG